MAFAAALGAPSVAQAHNYPSVDSTGPCNKNVKWGSASQTFYHALVWRAEIVNGTSAAAAQFAPRTDFSWTYSSSSPNTWTDLRSSDTSIAGATGWPGVNCSATPGIISKTAFYWNLSHFASGHGTGSTLQNYYQCTALHEFGHGLGLGHNQVSPSIMYADHGRRCHTNSWRTLQTHDISDINAKY